MKGPPLDLYLWLTYWAFTLKCPLRLVDGGLSCDRQFRGSG